VEKFPPREVEKAKAQARILKGVLDPSVNSHKGRISRP